VVALISDRFLEDREGIKGYFVPTPKMDTCPIGHLGENFGSLTAFITVT
jgi:hypothetical protein